MRISDWSSDVCSSDLLSKRLTHGYRTTLCESFVQFLDGGQVVEIVDHHPRTLPQPLFRAVGHPVQLFEPGAIAEVEPEIGRASCRERVCQYVSISVVAVSLKKQKNKQSRQKRQ